MKFDRHTLETIAKERKKRNAMVLIKLQCSKIIVI